MIKFKSKTPDPIRCENCARVLIDRVYLDEKGNTAIDAHGEHEDIQYDEQSDEQYVDCPECHNRQKVSLRLPV